MLRDWEDIGFHALFVMELVYILLLLYIVAGGWRKSTESHHSRLLSMLVTPALLFAAFYLSGYLFWGHVAWTFFYTRDRPPSYYENLRLIRIVVALVAAAIVLIRMMLGRAPLRYIQVTVISALLILLTTVFVVTIENND
jgi:hypothetical protein